MKFFLFSIAAILFVNSALADNAVQIPKTCEDVLALETCDRLRAVARKFHEKVGTVNQAVTDAFKHHKTKAVEVLTYVKEYLVDKAVNFKCEDVLPADQCHNLLEFAKRLNVKASEASIALREAIADGTEQAKQLYQRAVSFLVNDVPNLKCEDFFKKDDTCDKIRNFATKVNAKAKDVTAAVKKAIVENLENAKDGLKKAKEFLKAKISCDQVLNEKMCNTIQSIGDKFSVSMKKIDAALREAYANGIRKWSELYEAAIKYIMDKWSIFGDDEPQRERREIQPENVKKAIKKLLDSLKVKSKKVRAAITKLIESGKVKFGNLRKTVKQLLASLKGDKKSEDAVTAVYKRSVVDTLKETLQKLKEQIKDLAGKAKEQAKAKIAELKELIKGALGSLDQDQSDELDQDFEMISDVLEAAADESFDEIANNALENHLGQYY